MKFFFIHHIRHLGRTSFLSLLLLLPFHPLLWPFPFLSWLEVLGIVDIVCVLLYIRAPLDFLLDLWFSWIDHRWMVFLVCFGSSSYYMLLRCLCHVFYCRFLIFWIICMWLRGRRICIVMLLSLTWWFLYGILVFPFLHPFHMVHQIWGSFLYHHFIFLAGFFCSYLNSKFNLPRDFIELFLQYLTFGYLSLDSLDPCLLLSSVCFLV